jgi:hypothetical protein
MSVAEAVVAVAGDCVRISAPVGGTGLRQPAPNSKTRLAAATEI